MARLVWTLVAICAALFVCGTVASTPEAKPFAFDEFFAGCFFMSCFRSVAFIYCNEWQVAKSTLDVASGEVEQDTLLGNYIMRVDNTTGQLLGRYFDNDTATFELSNEMEVVVDLNGPAAGLFKLGADEDEAIPLFGFNFVTQKNGMVVSVGSWGSEKDGESRYQFSIPPPFDKFTITVQTKDKVTMYAAHKVIYNEEKSFFQKYSSFIMIGVMMIFQTVMGNKRRQAQEEQARAAAAGGAVADDSASSSSGAKIEEITDSSSSKKKGSRKDD